MVKEKPVLINLLAIARYEHAPEYPIQFMTRGMLHLGEKNDAVLEYTESDTDEETGEILCIPERRRSGIHRLGHGRGDG